MCTLNASPAVLTTKKIVDEAAVKVALNEDVPDQPGILNVFCVQKEIFSRDSSSPPSWRTGLAIVVPGSRLTTGVEKTPQISMPVRWMEIRVFVSAVILVPVVMTRQKPDLSLSTKELRFDSRTVPVRVHFSFFSTARMSLQKILIDNFFSLCNKKSVIDE